MLSAKLSRTLLTATSFAFSAGHKLCSGVLCWGWLGERSGSRQP